MNKALYLLPVIGLVMAYSNPSWSRQKDNADITNIDSEAPLPVESLHASMVSADSVKLGPEDSKAIRKGGPGCDRSPASMSPKDAAQAKAQAKAEAENQAYANSLIQEADDAKKAEAEKNARPLRVGSKKFYMTHKSQSCPLHLKKNVKYVYFNEKDFAEPSRQAPSPAVSAAARAHGARTPTSLDAELEAAGSFPTAVH